MAKLKVFQSIILFHPTEEESKKGEKSKIIRDLQTLLEKDEKTAAMNPNFEIPEEYRDRLDQIEIIISNF